MYSSRPDTASSGEEVYDLFARGTTLLRDGHPHQAALLLGRAKRLEPDKASIREALGRALFMSGRLPHARLEFAKAVQIDPANDYAHFALALACERTGARARAVGHLKLALAMRPGTADYERALARLAG
jgi:tetratricopeptide (TPR) repeat protein